MAQSVQKIDPIHEFAHVVKAILLDHVGEANAIRREDLALQVWIRFKIDEPRYQRGMDRACRRAIAWLRRNDRIGALIASVANPAGYWIVGSAEELERSLAQREAAARTALTTCWIQRRRGVEALKALPLEQGELFERGLNHGLHP